MPKSRVTAHLSVFSCGAFPSPIFSPFYILPSRSFVRPLRARHTTAIPFPSATFRRKLRSMNRNHISWDSPYGKSAKRFISPKCTVTPLEAGRRRGQWGGNRRADTFCQMRSTPTCGREVHRVDVGTAPSFPGKQIPSGAPGSFAGLFSREEWSIETW